MNPLRQPRFWAGLASLAAFIASCAALVVAVWLLLVPRSAVYLLDQHGRPYDIDAVYSSGRSDEVLDLPDLDAPDGVPVDFVTSVRLGCGNAFTSGKNEHKRPGDGPKACSKVEKSRRIIGICLAAFGVVGLPGTAMLRLPAQRTVG